MRIAWLACLVPSIAVASPTPEVSVQGGLDSVNDPDVRATRSEQGWDTELEAGLRVAPRLSLLAFAGYARGPDYSEPYVPNVSDLHRRFHEYGLRFRFHLDHVQPLFFGAGVGLQQVDVASVTDHMAADNEISGAMFDLEAGLEARRLELCHCSMYVVAAYVRGANLDVNRLPSDGVDPPGNSMAGLNPVAQPPAVESLRLSVGMTWW